MGKKGYTADEVERQRFVDYLMKDFMDFKHKKLSLIEIFLEHPNYYERLYKKGKVGMVANAFLRDNEQEFREIIQSISVPAFRKYEYFRIIVQNYKSPNQDDKGKKPAKMTYTEQKNSDNHYMTGMFCIKDDSDLFWIEDRKAKYGDEVIAIPLYRCPKCERIYTTVLRFSNKRIIKIGDIEATNLEYMEKKESEDINYEIIDCYISNKTRECPECKSYDVKSIRVPTLSKKNKKIYLDAKKCEVCGKYIISYESYISCMYRWRLLNPEALEIIKQDRIERQRRKIEQRTEKEKSKQQRRIKTEKVTFTPEEELRRQAALARIEREQSKRAKIEEIRRANIEGKSNTKSLPTSTSTIEYEKIKDVWVYVYDRLSNRCSRDHGNSIISYTAFVPTMQSAHIKQPINVFFCKKCDRYFVNSEAISEYSKQHIFLRLKFKAGDTVYNRKAFSELALYGYTVREGGMTEAQRQGLLKVIIDNKLMKKHEIIKQIQENISYNGKKSGNERAVEKWRDDLEFVQSYTDNNPTDPLIRGHYIRPGNRP